MWHPEITKQVIEAGMTVGTHTWSHKDLARNPYAKDLEQAEQEIEMGNSAVHMAAAGAPVAPFFRFPDLQHAPQLLTYLGERNIAIFSTDIDSRDFKMHKPEQVIKSVMGQLEKRCTTSTRTPPKRFRSCFTSSKGAVTKWCIWCRGNR
jgi:peptidoglycan-N-acetylglucosamine deacetylase